MPIYKLAKINWEEDQHNLLQTPAESYLEARTMTEAQKAFEERGYDPHAFHIIQMPSSFSWEEAQRELDRNRQLLND